jgi:hypothetical protein
MYRGWRETLAGLAKNATEGLAAPSRIVPATLFLLAGQALPFVLLTAPDLPLTARLAALAACGAALAPRLAASARFQQPIGSALLQPMGIIVLIAVQWFAFVRALRGRPARWRGREYATAASILLLVAGGIRNVSAQVSNVTSFTLTDQHERSRVIQFPATNATFLVIADWKGSAQLEPWIKPVRERFGSTSGIEGIADVSAVPPGLRAMVRRAFAKQLSYPVMLDWTGAVTRQFRPEKEVPNIYVLSPEGKILLRRSGGASDALLAEVFRALGAP